MALAAQGTRPPSSGSTARTSRGYTASRAECWGPHEADEVTQDVFVRTWQKLGQFRGDSAFSTWLHRLAVNVVIERRRSFAIQRERMSDDQTALDLATVGPARADLKVDFEAAIEQLPPGAREIFVLHDVEGYKHREIGTMLDITTGTSKRQLHRARMLMRKYSERIMTMHEEWTDKLSDYLDGELEAADQAAVEAHLRECAECIDGAERPEARGGACAGTRRPPSAARSVARRLGPH